MAVRCVFHVGEEGVTRYTVLTEFEWNGGFAVSQSRKNIAALYENYHRSYPDRRLLEVSSKSESELGRALSAFSLTLTAPSGTENTVECFYQAGKVFERGGPYTDLLAGSSMRAKKDERLKSSGAVIGFELEGVSFPVRPATLFYEWLYLHALEQHPDLADQLMAYDGFTDIAFNPERGNACQAQACAVYVTLRRRGVLREALQSPEAYAAIAFSGPEKRIRLYGTGASSAVKTEPVKTVEAEKKLSVGDRVIHPVFGEGKVTGVSGNIAAVDFGGTVKRLGCEWVMQNCRVLHRMNISA